MSYLDILVLGAFRGGPAHGYQVREQVVRMHAGLISLNPNVLYPALHRFEAQGALEKTVEPQQGRPPRHVYRMTDRGTVLLHDLVAEMTPAQGAVDAEFRTRVAFFDLLEREEQSHLLDVRARALEAMSEQLKAFTPSARSDDWPELVRARVEAQHRAELRWVRGLRSRLDEDRGPARRLENRGWRSAEDGRRG